MAFLKSLKKILKSPACGCSKKMKKRNSKRISKRSSNKRQRGKRSSKKQSGGYRTIKNRTITLKRKSKDKSMSSTIKTM
jgi:hypothetical protein